MSHAVRSYRVCGSALKNGIGCSDPLAQFKAELRQLYEIVLSPTYADLRSCADRLGLELRTSTVSDLLTKDGRPRWKTVKAFVLACEKSYEKARPGRPPLEEGVFDLKRWHELYLQTAPASDIPPEPVRPEAEWPRQIGVVPDLAHCFHERAGIAAMNLSAVDRPGQDDGPSCQILHGLGGTGKTQLAVNLAQRMWDRKEVDLLVWISATSRDAIVGKYAQTAREVVHVEDSRDESAAESFLEWLKNAKLRWLIVLDDLTAPGDLRRLWPPVTAAGGRTVVTTQRKDAALLGEERQPVEVLQFTSAEADDFLVARLAGQPGLAAGAGELAAALGHLPIALEQATAYMLDHGLSCTQYLARFNSRRLEEVLSEEQFLIDDQPTAIPAIWSLSVERANALRPAGLARPALELASVLDTNGIPEQVFLTPAAVSYLAASRSSGPVAGPDDASDALHCLHRLSLLGLESGMVRVHMLVQRATRDRLPENRLREVVRAAADALLAAWPDTEPSPDQALLLRTNTAVVNSHDPGVLRTGGIHPLLIRAGRSLAEAGDVTAAAGYFCQLRDTADPDLDPSHPDLLRIRHHLAYCTGQGGDPVAAAAEAAEVAAALSRVLGRGHRDTLIARMYLARWRGLAGHAERAARDLERLVPRLSRELGDENSNTMTARNDAAHFRGRAGDAAGAMKAFTSLRADRQELLGANHPHTLTTRNDLAFWTGKAGYPAEAAREFASLVDDFTRVFGPGHPRTLATRGSAASFRCESGDDPAAAVTELEGVLAEFLRLHGVEHPFTRETKKMLADVRRLAAR